MEDLIQLPSLRLVAPDGTYLAEESSTTILQYTLPSLNTSDGGEYTCVILLIINGAGINRQGEATKEIVVVGML